MEKNAMEQRLAILESAAEAEQHLIEAEIEAERALGRARERLANVKKDFDRLKRAVDERQNRVNEARAMLTAVQERRANGPG